MNTWQNIPPLHQILCPMCQIIFSKYFVDVNKIFQKIFVHVHLFVFTCSPLMLIRSQNNILAIWSDVGKCSNNTWLAHVSSTISISTWQISFLKFAFDNSFGVVDVGRLCQMLINEHPTWTWLNKCWRPPAIVPFKTPQYHAMVPSVSSGWRSYNTLT
jgi:hypothetical protein